MNETTNYKLKKPESNEFVSIDDLNYNADKIDGELKNLNDKKVSASGGDIKDTVVSEFTASADQYPIPAAGDTPKTFLGKVKKFMEDIRSTVIGACYIGQIINNSVTNRSDLPLSAAQGKVLMDLYTVLNTKHDSDLKIYIAEGTPIYNILQERINKITFFVFVNSPDNPFSFNAGFGIAFHSRSRYESDQFLMLGISRDGALIETKVKKFSQS